MYPSIIHTHYLAEQEDKFAEQERFAAIRYCKICNSAARLNQSIWHYDFYHHIKLTKVANYDCLFPDYGIFFHAYALCTS